MDFREPIPRRKWCRIRFCQHSSLAILRRPGSHISSYELLKAADAAKRYKRSCALSERRLRAVRGGWTRTGVLLVGHESMVTKPTMAWASRPNPAPPESPQRATISGVIGSRLREAVIRKYTMGVSRQVE